MLLCSVAAQMIREEEGKVIHFWYIHLKYGLVLGKGMEIDSIKHTGTTYSKFWSNRILSLMLHDVGGLPLLWCFQAKDKSHRADTVEVPQGGFRMNPAPCRARSSTKHQSMKVTKGNRGSFEKMWKSWESAGPGSRSRPELLPFTPADLSSLSVEGRCVAVTSHFHSPPEVFKLVPAVLCYICGPATMEVREVASEPLKVTRDRETLLFSLAEVGLLSKSRAAYS